MTAADQPGISWEQAIDTATGALLDQEARRSSLAAREAAPTEYEREAVEVAALTLEERYRKQIEELRAQNGRLIEERNRALSQARHTLERLYDKANNDHKGRACDFAHLLMRERLDHDQTRAHRDSLLVLETAARAWRAECAHYQIFTGELAERALVAAVDSLPPKPDTPTACAPSEGHGERSGACLQGFGEECQKTGCFCKCHAGQPDTPETP